MQLVPLLAEMVSARQRERLKRRRARDNKPRAAPAEDDTHNDEEEDDRGDRFQAYADYYKRQKLFPRSGDHVAFLRSLRAPLPATFRRNGLRPAAFDAAMATFDAVAARCRGDVVKTLAGGAWWRLDLGRSALKHADDPALRALNGWLQAAARGGGVVRQELVSGAPSELLGVRPGDAVLDVCAAPGSKTSQYCEAARLVVANDADPRRAYILASKLRSLGCSSKCVVTCHRGQAFPATALKFDRVACDVPCSGDGTVRKIPSLLKVWARPGRRLHALQLQIVLRGLRLLKVGGTMVFSTCSFDPLENEAVVAAALRACQGAFVVRDCASLVASSPLLACLAPRPGLKTWAVLDDGGAALAYDPAAKRERRASLWPPEEPDIASQLPRCLRFYPHDSRDGGGFFAAVFDKVAELPAGDPRTRPRTPRAGAPVAGYRELDARRDAAALRAAPPELRGRLLTRSPAGAAARRVTVAPCAAAELAGLRLVAAGEIRWSRRDDGSYREVAA